MPELDGHVHRILRSMFAAGVIDYPQRRSVVDPFAGREVALKIEEGSIVLLKNDRAALPLDAAEIHTIAVIGAHSDVGMISGLRFGAGRSYGRACLRRFGPGPHSSERGGLVSHFAAEGN